MAKVTMPQLGETVIEGTILKWLKAEGDQVAQDEPLFEISTDKVDTEVPSSAAGVLTKILVGEGETVAVGTELAVIEAAEAGGAAGTQPESAQLTSHGTATGSERRAPDGRTGAGPAPAAPQPGGRLAAAAAPVPHPSIAPPTAGGPRSQILSPLVRRLAADHDVDLAQVAGTGTGGRITKKDVLGYLEARGVAAPAATPAARPIPPAVPPQPVAAPGHPAGPVSAPEPSAIAGGEDVVALSHLRKAIAEHMVASSQSAARAWTMVEVNIENIARLRERTKDSFLDREGFKLTYMPFVTRAVTEALLAHPMINAELRGEEIVVRHYVNMGIAVSIEGGLIVPVVMGADSMNLVGLARAINDVAARARSKQLLPDEVHGATFSITNPGPFGSVLSVPIINQPNTGILSFDAIQKRPVVIDDAIAIRHMVYLSMSWDHRVIDGALATQFLARVKENLETWDFAEDLGL